MMVDLGGTPDAVRLRQQHPSLLAEFDDNAIAAAIQIIVEGKQADATEMQSESETDEAERELRRPEWEIFRRDLVHPELVIRVADLAAYDGTIGQFVESLALVDKLRETRAFTGFNRAYPENGFGLADRKALLRKNPSPERWLPAYLVYGEGIFVQLREEELARWEKEQAVIDRAAALAERFGRVQSERQLRPRSLTPRFVLVHTLAHLVINRLTFECGYSSAALRERLYVSEPGETPMAGVLIYTAAGDAEGTMGGLVRMGKPGYFEPALRAALHEATWCAADPVCMEVGTRAGQGPDACNLAACHNCALVPETACEEFNRFLDRGLVVGTAEDRALGFFSQIATLV
jgi:hypothetical protein